MPLLPDNSTLPSTAGQVSVAGNLVGTPALLGPFIAGLDLSTFQPLPGTAAAVQSWPNFLASLPDPIAFGNEVLVQDDVMEKEYTARDYDSLWERTSAVVPAFAYRHFLGRYRGAPQQTQSPTLALVSDLPEATPALLQLTATGAQVVANASGDGVITDHNTKYISQLSAAKGRCPTKVVDLSSTLKRPLGHFDMVTDPEAVKYLVEQVILNWCPSTVCGGSAQDG